MLSETALELQREFDLSFTRAARADTLASLNLLAVRIGGDPYALQVDDIAGLLVDRHVVPIPTVVAGLLGLAGFRGQVAPVYDLAALLDYPRRAPPRWLVLARFHEPVALAFDAFDAHLSVAADSIVSLTDRPEGAQRWANANVHVLEAVQEEAGVRPIIRLPSVIEDIQQRVALAHPIKER